MNIYRVDNRDTGEFLGLFRAVDPRGAVECACREYGYETDDGALFVQKVYQDPELDYETR